MIDGLISGKLYGQPVQRTGTASGKPFTTAKVRTATGDGESLFVNVICFDSTTCHALLALADGDSVAMAGTLTPKVWQDKTGIAKPSLDLVCQHLLTPYHVQRKRKAVAASPDDGD